jgi:hypothetical protein
MTIPLTVIFLNITWLELALLLNFKGSKLAWKRVWAGDRTEG